MKITKKWCDNKRAKTETERIACHKLRYGNKLTYERKHKNLKIPSPKEAVKVGLSLGALGLGIGLLKKYSGGS